MGFLVSEVWDGDIEWRSSALIRGRGEGESAISFVDFVQGGVSEKDRVWE